MKTLKQYQNRPTANWEIRKICRKRLDKYVSQTDAKNMYAKKQILLKNKWRYLNMCMIKESGNRKAMWSDNINHKFIKIRGFFLELLHVGNKIQFQYNIQYYDPILKRKNSEKNAQIITVLTF